MVLYSNSESHRTTSAAIVRNARPIIATQYLSQLSIYLFPISCNAIPLVWRQRKFDDRARCFLEEDGFVPVADDHDEIVIWSRRR